jgi:osmotically inducible lipoprotein OsmB
MKSTILTLTALVSGLALTGCTTTDPTVRDAGRGAAIGAAGGAIIGAVVDGVSVGEGAAAGAVAGGVAGAVTSDGNRRYRRDDRGDCFYVRDGRREYVSRDYCR